MDKYKSSPKEVECPRCGNTYKITALGLVKKDGAQATIVCDACSYQFEVFVSVKVEQGRVRRWLFFWRKTFKTGEPEYSIYLREPQKDLFEGEV